MALDWPFSQTSGHTLERLAKALRSTWIQTFPDTWDHWGNFESCIEVLRRGRWSQKWRFVRSLEETEAWTRKEIQQYLNSLKGWDRESGK